MRYDVEDVTWFIITSIAWIIGLGLAAFVIFMPIDCARAQHSIRYGIVQETSWTPSRDSYGTGVGVSSKGSVVVMPTSSHEDEKFRALVKIGDDTETVRVPKNIFLSLKKGDRVRIHTVRSVFFSSDTVEP